MEKSKSFKKFLAITLAGATLFQTCQFQCKARTDDSGAVKVIGALGGLAIAALTCVAITHTVKLDNQETDIAILREKVKSQKERINQLESNLRECSDDMLENIKDDDYHEALFKDIAKDCIKMYKTSKNPILQECLTTLKLYHNGTSFTENDIMAILRATISHAPEIKEHNFDNWLKDCGLAVQQYKNIGTYNCTNNIREILKCLRDWEYTERVNKSFEKNRFLDCICKILSA